MTLEFFLNPKERHGLGTLIVDALLKSLEGASFISTSADFAPEEFLGSDSWEVATQIEYIDVCITNDELDIAIILENKIGHELNNPLDNYLDRVFLKNYSKKLMVVLAPKVNSHVKGAELDQYISKHLTYNELFEQIESAAEWSDFKANPSGENQRRSLEILNQFMEIRKKIVMDRTQEALELEEWIDFLEKNSEEINDFDNKRSEMQKKIRDRRSGLQEPIEIALNNLGFEYKDVGQGGRPTMQWNAYYFPQQDKTVQLLLSLESNKDGKQDELITVFSYNGPYANKDKKGEQRKALSGANWASTNEEIAEAFAKRAQEILRS